MPRKPEPQSIARQRLFDEVGRIDSIADQMLALAYPSPYRAAMSSLGYQTIYRQIQTSERFACERVFAPDDAGTAKPDLSYEGERTLRAFPLVAFSVAYELELAELLRMLDRAGVPVLRDDRKDGDPLVLAGGPLTFSNARPLAPFADAIVLGDADDSILDVIGAAFEPGPRVAKLEALAALRSVWVPSLHGEQEPAIATCTSEALPAWGPIRTPHAELRDMFLIEAVRGCSRRCQYCVMRGHRGRGMRIVPAERILDRVPDGATRIGLVGASVSDHPQIVEVVRSLADRGKQVGLSSLRPERLTAPFMDALRAAGYRTITTAMDGASERLRASLERNTTAEHLRRATGEVRAAGLTRMKLYLMVGLPGETRDDLDECADLLRELSAVLPVSLGVAPFCPKRGTPLEDAPFAGTKLIDQHLAYLRKRLGGKAEVRATSTRWAWVESVLARGGADEGLAVLEAVRSGGSYAAHRKAFEKLGHRAG